MVTLPPLLLAAFLRNLSPPNCLSADLSFTRMIPMLSNSWRQREFDDIGALTLRLQLLCHSLKLSLIALEDLFRPLGSSRLGPLVVLLPTSGYSPTVRVAVRWLVEFLG